MSVASMSDRRVYNFDVDFDELDRMAKFISNKYWCRNAIHMQDYYNPDASREEAYLAALMGVWKALCKDPLSCPSLLMCVMSREIQRVFTNKIGSRRNNGELSGAAAVSVATKPDGGEAVELFVAPPSHGPADRLKREEILAKLGQVNRGRQIAELMEEGYTRPEIAEKTGISRQRVDQLIREIRDILEWRGYGKEGQTRRKDAARGNRDAAARGKVATRGGWGTAEPGEPGEA